ncbi:MAG TPA: VWA domain-containing protein [Gemmatimonadaceae bacterium]|nr:VWA domain-containing protein [Gemmatimonadaceae bacterium]
MQGISWRARPRRWLLKARHRIRSGFQGWRERLVRRVGPRHEAVPLEDVHRRLELFLTALYGRAISISPLSDAHSRGVSLRARARFGLGVGPAMARCEGDNVLLPSHLEMRADAPALTRYRLLALEQAERLARGTVAVALPSDMLERDLYLMREGATIDARIARDHHGMAELLERERRDAAAHRPSIGRMSEVERAVELRLRALLVSRPDELEEPSLNPEASLAWAREEARTIRASRARYRGLPLAPIWGEPPSGERARNTDAKPDDKRDQQDSTRPSDDGPPTEAAAADSAESSSEEHEADTSEESERPTEVPGEPTAESQDDSAWNAPAELQLGAPDDLPPPTHYDEWSVDRGAYVRRAVAVRVHKPRSGDDAWIRAAMNEHGATVRRIRHQFEKFRARRTLLRRQRAGSELDSDALVEAAVDRRIGRPFDDRLYVDARPARRGVAIAVLIDASNSTDRPLGHGQRIIDVERIASFLASEALDALGDLYAIYSFGGQGASNVKLSVIKDFSEPNGRSVHERIGAIEPDGFTRLGAAIRHATAQLARQSAGHRLLLILSDGRPHDIDYQDRYGVEDTRQAVFEARASGVFPYCLTVDADASEYLPRLFGRAGHTVLRQPEHLPKALLAVVNALLARAR